MANYNDLKTGINAVIKTNGRQEISGAALNTALNNMITELGAGYQYMGVATPATNPGTPDANVFYLASEAGTYTNFGGIVISENEVCALVWNGTWTKQVTGAATAAQVSAIKSHWEITGSVSDNTIVIEKLFRMKDGAWTNWTINQTFTFVPSPGYSNAFLVFDGASVSVVLTAGLIGNQEVLLIWDATSGTFSGGVLYPFFQSLMRKRFEREFWDMIGNATEKSIQLDTLYHYKDGVWESWVINETFDLSSAPNATRYLVFDGESVSMIDTAASVGEKIVLIFYSKARAQIVGGVLYDTTTAYLRDVAEKHLKALGGVYTSLGEGEIINVSITNGEVIGASGTARTQIIPIPVGTKSIRIVGSSSAGNWVYLATAKPEVGQFMSLARDYQNYVVVGAEQEVNLPLSGDEAYFVTQIIGSAGQDWSDFELSAINGIVGDLREKSETIPTGIAHILPESEMELNIVKRARQITDIEWTPSFDIPRLSYSAGDDEELYPNTDYGFFRDVFKAGKKYKGLPYCRGDKDTIQWGYGSFKVGVNVPIEAFITAICNKGTCMQLESAYDGANHRASFFGTVCSSLVCYALGLDEYIPTASIPNIPGLRDFGLLANFALTGLRLGDVLNLATIHTGIVTDIVYENGQVAFVEIAEATPNGNENPDVYGTDEEGGEIGGVARRLLWPVEKFMQIWGTYNVFRYTKDVPYTPSPYVQIGSEVVQPAPTKMSCLPYMGNGFIYKVGSIYNSKILIIASGYTKMRVIKDGENWNADGTTDYYDITGLTEISLNFTAAGEYSAYLCDVTNGVITKKSSSCKWQVVTP